jgi:ubiquitin-protein ligase
MHEEVILSCSYPESCPKVKFISKVFHPQVNEEGLLNTQKEFPVWDAKKNFIWQLLTYVKKIFYKIDTSDAFNSTAADL